MEEYIEENPRLAFFVLLLFAIGLLIFGYVEYRMYYYNPHWETITVTEKGLDATDMERWLIYTEDEVYSVTDLPFAGFFHASDVYNRMRIGRAYKVYVSGERLPIFSAYKVIKEAEEK